ncbi:N-acetylmuramoyl-L-alanine amidase [Kallotenue papyrolyticum]|uniref:N-acetylmuramoyl-L-alanine amidase n=1 Tax=Kallotenue papyrolyticum TaxID=1325125 RepID=UPI000492729F|nr:N-acetylmuramoyl-L-alanine amidase [Kallotenue papyrolyticum]
MLRWSLLSMVLVGVLLGAAPTARAFHPPLVVLQAGHWRSAELPDEFSRLRGNTGAAAGGVREVDLNVDIAHRAAEYLRAWGNEAYVLPATVPPNYRADAFVAIHADGHANRAARGFKVATSYRPWIASDLLVRELADEYARRTGLPRDWRITHNMRGYYAFNSGLYQHTIAEDTPAAILEMGFLTNPTDRAYLVTHTDHVAWAIALGIARFLATRPAEGWPPPPSFPRDDIVEVLHDNVPLFDGPGREFNRVDRAARKERYAVVERRPGWAKLFFWSGAERWIEDFQTRPITIP